MVSIWILKFPNGPISSISQLSACCDCTVPSRRSKSGAKSANMVRTMKPLTKHWLSAWNNKNTEVATQNNGIVTVYVWRCNHMYVVLYIHMCVCVQVIYTSQHFTYHAIWYVLYVICQKQYLYLACYTDSCERPRISRAKMELSCQSVDEALAAGTRAGCAMGGHPFQETSMCCM